MAETPGIRVIQIHETVADLPVSLQIVVMVNSLWAHVKDSRVAATVDPLAMAIPTKFDDVPIATSILGRTDDEFGTGIAQRIARRLNAQCYVTCQLSEAYAEAVPAIEQMIVKAYNEATEDRAVVH